MPACGLSCRRMDDEPEEDHHGSARELGRQAERLLHGALDVATMDPAPHLANYGHGLAVAAPFAVKIHLDFFPIEREESAVEGGNLDAVMLREVRGGDFPGQVLEGKAERFAQTPDLLRQLEKRALRARLGLSQAVDALGEGLEASLRAYLGLHEGLEASLRARLGLGEAQDRLFEPRDALFRPRLGLSQADYRFLKPRDPFLGPGLRLRQPGERVLQAINPRF